MNGQLNESDFADLSAWMDGEVADERAAGIQRLVEQDPTWRSAWTELKALDSAMEAWSVPEPAADLHERLVRHAQSAAAPEGNVIRLVRWLGPVAVAAGLLLGVILYLPKRPTEDQALPEESAKDVQPVKRGADPGRDPGQRGSGGEPPDEHPRAEQNSTCSLFRS